MVVKGLLLAAAAALLAGSLLLPYWSIKLIAPQYPEGLRVTTYVTRLTGDVREIDELNHYIGMMKLGDAAKLERSLALWAVPVAALALVVSAFVGRRPLSAWLLRLPAIVYPFGVALDLAAWLWYAGHNLDPKAPLSTSIKPFTPMVIGKGTVGQFETVGSFQAGYWLALAAALLALATLLWPTSRRGGAHFETSRPDAGAAPADMRHTGPGP